MSEALDEWVDKLAIREVLERYMRYNDNGDLDRILELFEPDAAYQVVGHILIGHDQIRAFLSSAGFRTGVPRWYDPDQLLREPRSMHLSSNPVIDLDGELALAESEFQVVRRDDDGHARITLVGRYRDQLRKGADGRWRFVSRTGVSLAKGGRDGSDAEWRQALARMTDEQRSRLRLS